LFWSRVNKTDGCWLWTGATLRGYGRRSGRRPPHERICHRYAWIITNGPIPDGIHVLHRCDNPSCVRPDHLFLGTHQDNVSDMIAKDRHSHGDRHWSRRDPERVPRGECHYKSRLSDAQTNEIRAAPRVRGMQRKLAAKFGVSEALISLIVNGIVRRGVPAAPVPSAVTPRACTD